MGVGEATAAGLRKPVGLADGGVKIDGERRVFLWSGPGLPGPGQGFPAYHVELQGVSPPERTQEGPQCGRGPHLLAQHRGGAAGPQDPRVVDAVSSGKSGVDEGKGLHPDMTAAGSFPEVDRLVIEFAKAQLLGERGGQNKAGISDGAGIGEGY